MRALLEDLPAGVDVVVVRASIPADLVHRDEVATLVRERRGRLQEIVGSRHKVRLNARVLRSIVPDIAYRDVYICGPCWPKRGAGGSDAGGSDEGADAVGHAHGDRAAEHVARDRRAAR